jgi:protein TonB
MDDFRGPQFLLPESKTNMGALVGGAGASWLLFFLLFALLVWLRPYQEVIRGLPEFQTPSLVYLQEVGLGGGGGGGGNRSLAPPRASETPRVKPVEAETIPVATPEPVVPPEPVIAAEAPAVASDVILAVPGPTANTSSPSLGPGGPGGAGTGDDRGIGPGDGVGLGPGEDRGVGDKVYQPGSGIINPTIISSAKPSYTSEAMLRHMQGTVLLECIVTRTGSVDACRVVRSLDAMFGLDEQALKAARQFRFNPGRRQGEPVAVRVLIEIAFNMR